MEGWNDMKRFLMHTDPRTIQFVLKQLEMLLNEKRGKITKKKKRRRNKLKQQAKDASISESAAVNIDLMKINKQSN